MNIYAKLQIASVEFSHKSSKVDTDNSDTVARLATMIERKVGIISYPVERIDLSDATPTDGSNSVARIVTKYRFVNSSPPYDYADLAVVCAVCGPPGQATTLAQTRCDMMAYLQMYGQQHYGKETYYS